MAADIGFDSNNRAYLIDSARALMGIIFEWDPGLTRIEMPQDWVGHPQRKDYPLGGVPIEYRGATIPPVDTRRSYN